MIRRPKSIAVALQADAVIHVCFVKLSTSSVLDQPLTILQYPSSAELTPSVSWTSQFAQSATAERLSFRMRISKRV